MVWLETDTPAAEQNNTLAQEIFSTTSLPQLYQRIASPSSHEASKGVFPAGLSRRKQRQAEVEFKLRELFPQADETLIDSALKQLRLFPERLREAKDYL